MYIKVSSLGNGFLIQQEPMCFIERCACDILAHVQFVKDRKNGNFTVNKKYNFHKFITLNKS